MVQRNKGINFAIRYKGGGEFSNMLNPVERTNELIADVPPISFVVGPDVLSLVIADTFVVDSNSGSIVSYYKFDPNNFTGSAALDDPIFRVVFQTTTGSFSASVELLSASTVVATLTSSSETAEVKETTFSAVEAVYKVKVATEDVSARAILGSAVFFIKES